MAQQEQALWDTLGLMLGRGSGWTTTTPTRPNEEPIKKRIENGISDSELRGALVLKYKPADVEDTIYFMKYREYFYIDKAGGCSLVVYSLSDKALEVASSGKLPEDERKAFRDELWNIKPGMWGFSANLPEIMKRVKNFLAQRKRTRS